MVQEAGTECWHLLSRYSMVNSDAGGRVSHSPSSYRVPFPIIALLFAFEPQLFPFCPQSKDESSLWKIKSHIGVLGARVKHEPSGGCRLHVHCEQWPVRKINNRQRRKTEVLSVLLSPWTWERGCGTNPQTPMIQMNELRHVLIKQPISLGIFKSHCSPAIKRFVYNFLSILGNNEPTLWQTKMAG